MNFKKNIIRILLFGLGLGILLFMIGLIFHLSNNNIFMMLLIAYLIFIIIVVPYQIRKGNLVNHKMETLLQKLYQGEIDHYMVEMDKILEQTENTYLKAILTIHRCIGYTLKGEFAISNEHLEKIEKHTIDKTSQAILYHNIALNCFWLGEQKKACTLMEAQKELLQKGLELYPNRFSETFAFWFFAKGQKEQGFTYLENVIKSETAKPFEKQAVTLLWAKQKIAEKEQVAEAQKILQKIIAETNLPYLKKEAQKILETIEV